MLRDSDVDERTRSRVNDARRPFLPGRFAAQFAPKGEFRLQPRRPFQLCLAAARTTLPAWLVLVRSGVARKGEQPHANCLLARPGSVPSKSTQGTGPEQLHRRTNQPQVAQ